MENDIILRSIATLSFLSVVGACGSVTPAGFLAASRLDPLDTPPSGISMAVGVPKALQLRDGDATLRLGFRADTADSAFRLEQLARLQIRPAGVAGPVPGSDGERVFVARIAPEDVSAMEAVQKQIRVLRGQGMNGEGYLSIEVTGGCLIDERPDRIAISTWLRTEPTGDFVQLTRNADIARSVGVRNAEQLLANLRPCAE